jgi:hypothetical protein
MCSGKWHFYHLFWDFEIGGETQRHLLIPGRTTVSIKNKKRNKKSKLG